MKSYQRLPFLILFTLNFSCKKGTVVKEKVIENPAQFSTIVEDSCVLMSNLDSITLFKVVENADPNQKIIEIRYVLTQNQEELIDHTHAITRNEIEITPLDSLALNKLISIYQIKELYFYGDKSSIGLNLTLSKAEYHITPMDSYLSLQYISSKPSDFVYASNFSQLENDDFFSETTDIPQSIGKYTADLDNLTFFVNKYKTSALGLLTTEKSSHIIAFNDNKNPAEIYKGKGDNYILSIQPFPIIINKHPILFAEIGHPDFDEINEVILVFDGYKYGPSKTHRIGL